MGLDMYLFKVNKKERRQAKKDGFDVKRAEGYETKIVAMWSKANQIRQWFVNNTDYDIDWDAIAHKVTKIQLEKLRDDCKIVLSDHSKATTIMPTSSGSFFGSTDYDDNYYICLHNTAIMIDIILKETDFEKYRIEYYEVW